MGEAVDTIPSILNKCLFVSPDGRTIPSILNKCLFVSPDGRTDDGRTTDAGPWVYYKLTL